jgi:hypothetical protein
MIPFLHRFRKVRPAERPSEPDPTEREAADPGPVDSNAPSPAYVGGSDAADDLTDLAIRIALEFAGSGPERSLYLLDLTDLQLACVLSELRRALSPGVFAAVIPAGDHWWALEVWREGVKT